MARRLLVLVLLAAAALLALPAAPAGAAAREVQYVGKLKRSDAFVAIVRKGRAIRAYVCDGKPKRTTLSVWFRDRLRNAAFTETAAGVRLKAAIGRNSATGTVLLADDREFAFRAVRVARRGGLLERNDTFDGRRLHSGWIVLADRRVRGRTTIAGTSFIGSSTTGPGIAPTSTTPPSDPQALFSECELLLRDLQALNQLLQQLNQQKPVHPGSNATDEQLKTYFARLSVWQAAVADTKKKIQVVQARIDQTCG